MPRYFFDTADHKRIQDAEGTELPDDGQARVEAITVMGEILRDKPELLDPDQTFRVEVRDAHGVMKLYV
jgi:hypothetical protein